MSRKGWKELPIGGIIDKPGSSEENKTGAWRTYRPILDPEKCIHCFQCWIYCPDNAVLTEEGKVTGFDLDHCKGCGICAEECPEKIRAIEMVLETECDDD